MLLADKRISILNHASALAAVARNTHFVEAVKAAS